MTLRKIHAVSNAGRTLSAKVFRDAEWNEYRVRHYYDGVLHAADDYHTDDKAEAIDHANAFCSDANRYSRADENQQAFAAWFDALPADLVMYYAAAYNDGTLDVYAILRDGNQAAGWCDSFIDGILTAYDQRTGLTAIRNAYWLALTLSDDMPEAEAIAQAAAQHGVSPQAVHAMWHEYNPAEESA